MSGARATAMEPNEDADTASSQFLTFVLDGEEYGVDILRVQEIRGWSASTRLPNTPDYLQGVLNLRGTVVPIIDLRLRFGIEKIDCGPTTVIIVLKAVRQGRERVVGLVVDGVSDVCRLQADEMKPAPELGNAVSIEFIKGMATIGDKMVILLDVDNLLNNDDMALLDDATCERRSQLS